MPIIDRTINPLTGLVTDIGFEDGKMHIRYAQRTQETHQRNKDLRDSDEYTKNGIKQNFMHAVHLSDADCLKMMVEDGVNPYTCSAKDLRSHISKNRDKYGHLFVTRGQI